MLEEVFKYLQHHIQHNDLAAAGAITAGISTVGFSIWATAKSWPLKVYSYFQRRCVFHATIEHTDPVYQYVDNFFAKKYPHKFRKVEISTKESKPEEWEYDGDGEFRPVYKKARPLQLTHENDYVIFWHKFRKITSFKGKEKLEGARNTYDMFRRSYTFSGLFARKAILSLIESILDEGIEAARIEKEEQRVIKLYTHATHGAWSAVSQLKGKTFDSLFLPHKKDLMHDLDDFLNKKELYAKLNVPFKRGYLFYGLPGNGKSATAFAIAEHLRYDLYVLNVNSLYPDNFQSCVNKIPSNSILLIEDIDAAFHKRKSSDQNGITFGQFINALSGIDNKENILTIFTTNHVDKLDAALIRDGRCDKKIEFKNPTKKEVQGFLNYALPQPVHLRKYTPNKCFAEVQNIVLKNFDNRNAILAKLES